MNRGPTVFFLGEPEPRETRGKQVLRFVGNKINLFSEGFLIGDFFL